MIETTRASARRIAALSLGLAAVSISVLGFAGTANAATTQPAAATSCSLDLGTNQVTCVPEGQDLNAAVLKEQGLVVTTPTAGKSARALSPQATFVQSQLYDDANYGGSFFQITNSAACNGSTVYTLSNLGSYGWSGRVSSFKSFSNCSTKVWEKSSPGGSSYGFNVNASNLGAMNDKANSAQMK